MTGEFVPVTHHRRTTEERATRMPSEAAAGEHDRIEEVVEHNREAIRAARAEEERLDRSLRRSDAAALRIKRVLHRAGLLRRGA